MTDDQGTGRVALVTGVTGQDGIYLARLLAAEGGTRVVGTARPGSAGNPRIPAYLSDVAVVELDIRDSNRLSAILDEYRPDEIYNLAAFTSVGASWDASEVVAATNATAVTGLLQALLDHRQRTGQDTRVFHASSGSIGGDDSPYSAAKAAAETAIVEFREAHGVHACFAKLHNHESPLRGSQFVTRKITEAAARIAGGDSAPLKLGNIDVRRDWGFAGDYVEAMRRMVRRDEPIDLEIGTGIDHSLRDLISIAFEAAGIDDAWKYIELDADLMRPTDAPVLVADPGPAQAAIGWTASVSFHELIEGMVAADIARRETGVAEDPRYLQPAPTTTVRSEAL